MAAAAADDDELLDYLFDPESQGLPLSAEATERARSEAMRASAAQKKWPAELLARVRELERRAVAAADAKPPDLDAAQRLLDEAVALGPDLPSPLNNRAQLHLLRGAVEAAAADAEAAVSAARAVGDLEVLKLALCQRAITTKRGGGSDVAARRDLEEAAALGSRFAKLRLVEMNPYAAMCNQMLQQAMSALGPRVSAGAEAGSAEEEAGEPARAQPAGGLAPPSDPCG